MWNGLENSKMVFILFQIQIRVRNYFLKIFRIILSDIK